MLISCPECSREVSDSAPSCPGCGFVLKTAPAAESPPAQLVDAQPNPAPAPAGKPGLSTEQQMLIEQRVTNEGPSAGVAYLLWLFVGLLSGHRFYLGRPGTALLQILSYFILIGFVWWLIDAFLIPEMLRSKRDEIRRRLQLESLVASGHAPPNAYQNLPTYHDPARAAPPTIA